MATSRLVRIDTYAPVPTSLTLEDGSTSTGYALLAESTWGDAVWEHVEAGVRGTQGRLAATGYPLERQARLVVRVAGASKSVSDARVAALDAAVDELRQYGGRVCLRENGSAVRMYLDVLRVAGVATVAKNDATAKRDVVADLICGPYLLGDPLDAVEGWASDSVAAGEWTVDEGAVTRAGGGACLLSGQTRLRLTGSGYQYGDAEAMLAYTTPASTTGISAMVCLCADPGGADTMLGVELTSAALRVVKREAGSATTLATTAYAASGSTTYWLVVRREAGKVVAEVYTVQPGIGVDTPAASVTAAMTVAEQAKFVRGHVAVRMNATSAAVPLGAVRVRAYVYSAAQTPTNIPMLGAVPGSAPALADLHIAAGAASGSGSSGSYAQTYPVYALAGWSVALPANRAGGAPAVTTVTNVIAASSSIAGSPTAVKYGRFATRCDTTGGTTGQGVAWRILGEYRQSRVYCALAWMRAVSGTPSTFLRLRASASADGADSGAVALSTSAWTLFSCAWTPTADRQDVYVAAAVNGTAVASFQVDGVVVWDCDPAALSASMLAGTSGARDTLTVTATPDSVVAPCLALIDSELVQVESISGSTWTIVRGREGTTNAAHSAGAVVYALPPFRSHAEGEGAPPPLGVVYAANTGISASTNLVTDADYASGLGMRSSFDMDIGSGVPFDPGVIAGDPYTETVDVDVYARLDVLTTTCAISTFGTRPATAGAAVMTSFGAFASKQLVLPTGATSERFVYLGPLTFRRVEGVWSFVLAASVSGLGADYFFVVPRRTHVRSAEGKPLDSSYPEQFASSSSWRSRVWEADGSGYIVDPYRPDVRYPYHGIGGSMIELDPGPNTLVVKLSNHVPEDPTVGSGADYERIAATLHLAVTPRFMTVRDA